MEWISNADMVAILTLAIFGIGGYLFGIVTYLKKKASAPPQQTTTLTQMLSPRQQESSVPLKSISWLEWIEIFTQGLIDTADFLFNLFSMQEEMSDKTPAG